MPEPSNLQEITQWLERLLSARASEQDRVQAASEMSRIRIRMRGAVKSRGSLSKAARSVFPPSVPDAMSQILRALQDEESPLVRTEVAASLGLWGDDDEKAAAKILNRMVVGPEADMDERVRRASVRALGLIGGPEAIKGLCAAAEHDPEEGVRRDSISALVELALQESAAAAAPNQQASSTARDAHEHPRPRLSPEAQAVLNTLKRINVNESEKKYLRQKAKAGVYAMEMPT